MIQKMGTKTDKGERTEEKPPASHPLIDLPGTSIDNYDISATDLVYIDQCIAPVRNACGIAVRLREIHESVLSVYEDQSCKCFSLISIFPLYISEAP